MTQESIFTVIGRTTKSLVNERLPLSGGTLSGPLLLSGDPTQGLEAATKGYVDNLTQNGNLTEYARLDGADFIGDVAVTNLTLSGDLTINGDKLGTMEQFLGNVLLSSGTATILKTEFDAVATNGVVAITGTSSPFASTTITTSYGTPTEITYELKEVSNDGTDTLVGIQLIEVTQGAYDNLTSTGNITLGGSVITFN